MKLLLDTHVFFWAMIDPTKISPPARAAIEVGGNHVHVSIASAWEMAIKVGIGKWPEAVKLVDHFEIEANATGFRILPINISHVRTAGLIQNPHRDPFDRLLAAQAMIEGLSLVTADAKMTGLGAKVLW